MIRNINDLYVFQNSNLFSSGNIYREGSSYCVILLKSQIAL